MTKRIRTLTVSRLYREWGEPHHKGECVVPSIRLNGRWLAALGFEPGQKIRVTTNGATLTLAPITFESDSEIMEPRLCLKAPYGGRGGVSLESIPALAPRRMTTGDISVRPCNTDTL